MQKMNSEVKRLRSIEKSSPTDDTSGNDVDKTIGDLKKEVEILLAKNKKNVETLKIRNKALKESEEGKNILAKNLNEKDTKLEEERNKNVRMQADMIRMSKLNDKTDEILNEDGWEQVKRRGEKEDREREGKKEREREERQDRKEREERNERQKRKERDERKENPRRKDCTFFLRGSCMFNKETCRNYHNSRKYGIQKRSENERRRTFSHGNLPHSPRRSPIRKTSTGDGILKSLRSDLSPSPKGFVEQVTEIVIKSLYSTKQSLDIGIPMETSSSGRSEDSQNTPQRSSGTNNHRRSSSVTFQDV